MSKCARYDETCDCPACTDDRAKPFAYVLCSGLDPAIGYTSCGVMPLTKAQYERQMDRPDSTWRCPKCGAEADYDDVRSEAAQGVV